VSTRARTHRATALRFLAASRRVKLGAGALVVLALVCFVGSAIVPMPSGGDDASAGAALGRDSSGRDVVALLLHGGRAVLGAAIVAVLVATVSGALVGAGIGLSSARRNRTLERWLEAVDTFPAIVVVALFRTIQEHPSNVPVIAAVAIVKWAEVARIVRAEGLRLGTEEFVLASRALGASRFAIARRHVIPHVSAAVGVSAALGIASVVLLDTAVSFLGMGPSTDAASWGGLLGEGLRAGGGGPLVWAPLALLTVTVAAAYLVADALRDAVDPHAVRTRSLARREPPA
jgi:peptide/nickel transport system permease protein